MPDAAETETNLRADSGFIATVGLQFDVVSAELVIGHLEAGPTHHTPWGTVHGGLYATLVESAASVGASMAVQAAGRYAVGVSNQTDFLRPHRLGRLEVRAKPVQQGRTLQLWVVEITDTAGKLVARGQVRLFNQDRPTPT